MSMRRFIFLSALGVIGALSGILCQPQVIWAEVPGVSIDMSASINGSVTTTQNGQSERFGTFHWDTVHNYHEYNPYLQPVFEVLSSTHEAGYVFGNNFAPFTYIKINMGVTNMWDDSWFTKVEVLYHFEVNRLKTDCPTEIMMPILIEVRGETACTDYTYATAHAELATWNGGNWGAGYYYSNYTDYEELLSLSSYPRNPTSKKETFLVPTVARVGSIKAVYMYIVAGNWNQPGDPYPYMAMGGALVDPVITIDPNFMVNYHGEMVPANTLYSIQYSPEIKRKITPPLQLLLD